VAGGHLTFTSRSQGTSPRRPHTPRCVTHRQRHRSQGKRPHEVSYDRCAAHAPPSREPPRAGLGRPPFPIAEKFWIECRRVAFFVCVLQKLTTSIPNTLEPDRHKPPYTGVALQPAKMAKTKKAPAAPVDEDDAIFQQRAMELKGTSSVREWLPSVENAPKPPRRSIAQPRHYPSRTLPLSIFLYIPLLIPSPPPSMKHESATRRVRVTSSALYASYTSPAVTPPIVDRKTSCLSQTKKRKKISGLITIHTSKNPYVSAP